MDRRRYPWFNRLFASVSGVARDDGVVPAHLGFSCFKSAHLPHVQIEHIYGQFGVDNIRIGDLHRNFEVIKKVICHI